MEIDVLEIIKNTLPILWKLWPAFLSLFLFLLLLNLVPLFFNQLGLEIDNWSIRRKFKKGEEWRSDRDILYWLRGMKPSEFEHYIADLFSRLGYKTQVVGRPYDGGIDVIAEKDGVRNYIQCKKFITQRVTVSAVRDFYGALADRLANGQGYLITTNKFTLEARKFAEDKPIELIDGFSLIRYIRMAKKENNFSNVSTNRVAKICPRCGGNLVERTGKFGTFYGCSNYPKCKYTLKKD